MSRGSVRFLSLLVCVCFTLSMLFSSTLQVSANNITQSYSGSFIISADGVGVGMGSATGTTVQRTGAGTYHIEMPFTYIRNLSDFGLTQNFERYYEVNLNASNISFDYPSYGGFNYSNVCVKDYLGNLLWTRNNPNYVHRTYSGSEILIDNKIVYPFYLVFDCKMNTDSPREGFEGGVTFNLDIGLYLSSHNANGTPTYDSSANQKLNQIYQSQKAVEDSVTKTTGDGILATIKNFFGSFFQNVFNTLVSVFVPEDGFFSDWFNRLNTLLSEKLGMLYAPFDLLITTLNAIMNADTTDTGIPFPGIQWEDTYLVEPFTFYFSSLGDTFTDLQGYVYFATDTVLLFAFLYLLQNKIRLILEGHESG